MNEPNPKKTMLVWRPPAGATQAPETPAADGGKTQIAPGVVPAAEAAPAPVPAPARALETAATVQAPAGVPPGGTAPPALAPMPTHSTVRPSHGEAPRPHAGPLSAGDIIGGRYKIQALAGEGGFAAVYRATDNQIPNHEVAVKLLNAPAEGVFAQEAALRELTLIAAVSHPSVVQFKDYGWHDGRLFFAMPWYRGKTLGSAAPLDRADARRVFERSAYGLQAMHDAGINHHDIKPDNIFLADIAGFEAGFPVLLDLGIASKRGEKPTALTPEYASPETAASILQGGGGGIQVGSAADVFSLALSLRNVLDPDSAPQVGESLVGFLNHRANEPIEAPSTKDLAYLKPSFDRWLNIDPSVRPTAAELAAELAVLTAPEERRADRKRMLLRALPIIGISLVIVGVLWAQLSNKTQELVQQKQQTAKENVATNQRFEKLKLESKDQLDDKLQLAQEFQSQRDQFQVQRDQARKELTSTTGDLNRSRSELKKRTTERDQTRTELQLQTAALDSTRSELTRRTQEVEARTRDLAQARAELGARLAELAQRQKQLDDTQSELKKRTKELDTTKRELETQEELLAAQRADYAKQNRDLKEARAELSAKNKELDKAEKSLDKAKAERDEAEAEVKALKKQLKQQDSAAAAQAAKAAAASGSATPLKKKKK